ELGRVLDLGQHVGHPQDRLGGNAGVVEAAPADDVLLDDGGLHAQLRGADRGDIPARTRADHDAIERIGHPDSAYRTSVGSHRAPGRSGIWMRAMARTSFQKSGPASPRVTRQTSTPATVPTKSSEIRATARVM